MQNKASQAKKENREGKASADKKIEKAKKTKAKNAVTGKKKNGAKPMDNTANTQIKPAETVKAKAPSKQTRTTSKKHTLHSCN